MRLSSPYLCPTPSAVLVFCMICCLLPGAQASAMGPRPDELPRFEGDTDSTVFESYSSAKDGQLLSYTLVAQFSGCPDQAEFSLNVDAKLPVVMLPGVEQLERDDTCLRIEEIFRGEETNTVQGRLGGCERGGLTATIPLDCPEGCSPPTIQIEHDCAHADVWVAGQPEIMDSRTAPRELGWIEGPHHTLVGFHFSALQAGPFQIRFSRDADPELEVVAVHFISDPEAAHTARVESLGADGNLYSTVVHAPGEYEMLVLLSSEDPLDRIEGQLIPPTPVVPTAVETDYAAATRQDNAEIQADGSFSFIVDHCAGAWGRRNGLCPEKIRTLTAESAKPSLASHGFGDR